MAQVDLQITFDRADPCYQLGEEVCGRVFVKVKSGGRCDGFTITCEWHTHGKGSRSTGDGYETKVPSQELEAGHNLEIPFAFPIKCGPLSYHGHLLNVDWYIRATADLPWALDAHVEEDFLVIPNERDDRLLLPGQAHLLPVFARLRGRSTSSLDAADQAALAAALPIDSNAEPSNTSLGLTLLGAAALCLTGVFVPLLDDAFRTVCATLCLVTFAAGLFGCFPLLKNALARWRLGEVQLTIQPAPIAGPGEELQLALRLRPRVALQLESVRAEFRGLEVVVDRSGSNREVHQHSVHFQEISLGERCVIGARQTVTFAAPFQVPVRAAPSFLAEFGSLTWTLELRVELAGWPSYVTRAPIFIMPMRIAVGLRGAAAR